VRDECGDFNGSPRRMRSAFVTGKAGEPLMSGRSSMPTGLKFTPPFVETLIAAESRGATSAMRVMENFIVKKVMTVG
jgi:hypothetical protein